MICTSCSATLPDEALYCSACGQQVSSVSQAPTGLASPSAAAAAMRRSPSSVPVGRLASSDSIEGGAFAAGTVLIERYRIIGLLGRGGMGEVYRADDLTLGQPVALKFLPRAFSSDAARRDRFFAEVRNSRQVSHPNVCRVYDVGRIDGQYYLSMEYVDGEDLASLLRRIGRPPQDKALELSRELCAGLAAAHDKRVLHRDLKPANVMIDGRGRARITDFGLAVISGDEASEVEIAGTPAYMAPEQLAGKGASVRSDIYSLGLLLYELFTGKRAFEAGSVAELRRQKEVPPTAPSQITRDLDPKVEKVILRCLEKDPARRPASALQVSAGLPGGDALAAALAAGQTPSPETVAAAGESSGLAPRVALACLVATLAGLVLAVLLADRLSLVGHVPLDESPDALVARAQEIATRSGYAAKPFDRAWGFQATDYIEYVRSRGRSSTRWRDMEAGRPPAVTFWYRSSPRWLAPIDVSISDRVELFDPPRDVSGMLLVVLDTKGRLLEFEAVPPQTESNGPIEPPDWEPLFAAAGLKSVAMKPADPVWVPNNFANTRAAWTGTFPELPGVPIRIEAAAYRGKPIAFRVVWPWTRPTREKEFEWTRGEQVRNMVLFVLLIAIIVCSVLAARRNVRLNRGDRRGAFRFAVFVFAGMLAEWAIRGTHVGDYGELRILIEIIAEAVFVAGLTGTLYLAIEPFVRRRWPDVLVSWARISAGQFRDPVVGRDVLIGALVGVACLLVIRVNEIVAARFEPYVQANTLLGIRFAAAGVVDFLVAAVIFSLAYLFLLVLLRATLRKEWLAAAAFVALFVFLQVVGSETPILDAGFMFLVLGGGVLILMRFGLVTFATVYFVRSLLHEFPITRDLSAWYAPSGMVAVIVVAAIAIYGFRTTLEGRPVFKGFLDG
jgi:hypothetical protein